MAWVKQVLGSPSFQNAAGLLAAEYLRLVWNTSRMLLEPADIYERAERDMPIIIAMWHGQHFLAPFIRRPGDRGKVLISRHRDGEMNARVVERLGIGAIRGSGHLAGGFVEKGGISAFHEMLTALADGCNVALTADVPKIARVAGPGIIKLAAASGRPIYPIAIATRHRFELNNWDRTTINLPFGRAAGVAGDLVRVPPAPDPAVLEDARRALQLALDDATTRAYALVDQR